MDGFLGYLGENINSAGKISKDKESITLVTLSSVTNYIGHIARVSIICTGQMNRAQSCQTD